MFRLLCLVQFNFCFLQPFLLLVFGHGSLGNTTWKLFYQLRNTYYSLNCWFDIESLPSDYWCFQVMIDVSKWWLIFPNKSYVSFLVYKLQKWPKGLFLVIYCHFFDFMRSFGQFFNLKTKKETPFLLGNINNHLETCNLLLFSNVEFKFLRNFLISHLVCHLP